MYLDAIALEARNLSTLAHFWSKALGIPALEREPAGIELFTPHISLWLIPATATPADGEKETITRLHLDLNGGTDQSAYTRHLLSLGAQRRDVGQGEVPWEVLADVEDNLFCVMPSDRYEGAGPGLGSLPVDSASPQADRDFWAKVTGWTPVNGNEPGLRHPHGPDILMEFCEELEAKQAGVRNVMSLVLRLSEEEREANALARLTDLGARLTESGPREPWHLLTDPSGNEFRLLSAHTRRT